MCPAPAVVFLTQSVEAIENKSVEFLEGAKKYKRVRKSMKRKNLNEMRVLMAVTAQTFPKWEECPHTPGVFVRVASKGLTGYGTWKKIRKMGDKEE